MMTLRMLFVAAVPTLLVACSRPAATAAQEPEPAQQPVLVDDGADTTAATRVQEDRSTVPYNENGPRYTWSIAPAANGTFGFAIYDRGKLYIDQQKATGLGGPDGWKSKVDARTAALAAMEKLEKGEVPEGLTIVGQ